MRNGPSMAKLGAASQPPVSSDEASLLRSLLYFEIFNFPLTVNEIWKFSGVESKSELKGLLDQWVQSGYILREGGYYMLNSTARKVAERMEAEQRAGKMWPKAVKKAKLIQSFPFIRAVFISGSISKGVVAPDGDVDFFIITKPDRLWLSRILLTIYKKLFLLGSRRYFCINYFIDDAHLHIEEHNRFTATEMATLIPMCGSKKLIDQFYLQNDWVNDFYPNFQKSEPRNPVAADGFLKKSLESVLEFTGASWMDRFSQWLATSFWRLKFRKMHPKDFNHALKSNRHVSKHHPLQFQKRVLTQFENLVNDFEDNNGIALSSR